MNYHSDVCNKCMGTGWMLDEKGFASKCECYENMIQESRLKFAKIPAEYDGLTVNSFDTSLYDKETDKESAKKAKKITSNYVLNFDRMKDQGKGLYYFSRTRGSGKTRLAVSLGNALIIHKKQKVRFITTLDLLDKIKSTFNKDSEYTEQGLLNDFYDIDVLILDDLGAEKSTPFVEEVFFKILDTRLTHKKITIFTSNLNINDINRDERSISRIKKMALIVEMPNADIRGKLGNEENMNMINELLGL